MTTGERKPGEDEAQSYRGECLCGGVRFVLHGTPREVRLCHCHQCRSGTGAAFNVSVPVDEDAVNFEARDTIREFESSPGKFRAFCDTCGAAVYSRRPSRPGNLRLRGGLIRDLPRADDLRHIFWKDRWPWIDTIDDAPKSPAEESAA